MTSADVELFFLLALIARQLIQIDRDFLLFPRFFGLVTQLVDLFSQRVESIGVKMHVLAGDVDGLLRLVLL